MGFTTRLFRLVFAALGMLLPAVALAHIDAALVSPAGPRPGSGGFELLEVQVSAELAPDSPALVIVQDLRGGPAIARHLPAGVTQILLPLPLVDPSALPRQGWPVRVELEVAGKRHEQKQISLVRMDASSAIDGDFRIIVPKNAGDAITSHPAWSNLTGKPLLAMAIAPDEILGGSPLLFAGFDALLVTPALQDDLSQERAIALINVGLQLVATGDVPPVLTQRPAVGAGPSPILVWEKLASPTGATTWICPPQPLRRPNVLEPGLASLSPLQIEVPTGVRWIVLLVGPAALVAILLASQLFRARWLVLGAVLIGCGTVATGAILLLKSSDDTPAHQPKVASWQVTHAPASGIAAAWTTTESLHRLRPLFDGRFAWNDRSGGICYPVASTSRDYFEMRNVRLLLDSPEAKNAPAMHLDIHLQGRQQVRWLSRQLHIGLPTTTGSDRAILPALPRNAAERARFTDQTGIDLQAGAWIDAGYLTSQLDNLTHPTTIPATSAPSRELFSTWARRQPDESAATWYELRFDARHLYFHPDIPRGNSAAKPVPFWLIDFGSPPRLPEGNPSTGQKLDTGAPLSYKHASVAGNHGWLTPGW